MNLLIRIPLNVENMNALAGYYTDGPSIVAMYGLISQLEQDADFTVHRFGLAVERYEARHSEILTTGFDVVKRDKQSDAVRPTTGYRYANLKAALYLETDALSAEDQQQLLADIERSINTRRVQGGNLVEYISAKATDPVHMTATNVRYDAARIAFIAENEKPLTALYLSMHLPQPLQGDELIEAYAEALSSKDTFMVCHGYILIGTMPDSKGVEQNIGEPSYTLAQTKPVYAFKALTDIEQSETLKRFFWAFDHQQHNDNPATFFIN